MRTGGLKAQIRAKVKLREEKEKGEKQPGESGFAANSKHIVKGIELRKDSRVGQGRSTLIIMLISAQRKLRLDRLSSGEGCIFIAEICGNQVQA